MSESERALSAGEYQMSPFPQLANASPAPGSLILICLIHIGLQQTFLVSQSFHVHTQPRITKISFETLHWSELKIDVVMSI